MLQSHRTASRQARVKLGDRPARRGFEKTRDTTMREGCKSCEQQGEGKRECRSLMLQITLPEVAGVSEEQFRQHAVTLSAEQDAQLCPKPAEKQPRNRIRQQNA